MKKRNDILHAQAGKPKTVAVIGAQWKGLGICAQPRKRVSRLVKSRKNGQATKKPHGVQMQDHAVDLLVRSWKSYFLPFFPFFGF